MGYIVVEIVELGRACLAIAEQAHAEAFPVAVVHLEGLPCRREMSAVEAIVELVTIESSVEDDTQVYPARLPARSRLRHGAEDRA